MSSITSKKITLNKNIPNSSGQNTLGIGFKKENNKWIIDNVDVSLNGINVGDEILEVNGTEINKINKIEEVTNLIAKGSDVVTLTLLPTGNITSYSV